MHIYTCISLISIYKHTDTYIHIYYTYAYMCIHICMHTTMCVYIIFIEMPSQWSFQCHKVKN